MVRSVAEAVEGTELPIETIDVTTTMVVSGALMTRDYQPVHHDRDAAFLSGSDDVFMNILTTNGLVENYVMKWVGAAALIRSIRIQLGAPNYPGDALTMTGRVRTRVDTLLTLDISGTNSRGQHVSGSVEVELGGVKDV